MKENLNIENIIDICKRAGEILSENYYKEREVKIKEDGTPVTKMDLKVEKFLNKKLKKINNSFTIISEELGDYITDSEYKWVIDPLDGTQNYLHRIPVFGIMVALWRKEEPIKSVVHFPIQKETYFAEKGKGAFLNNKRIKVSNESFENGFVVYDSSIMGEKEGNAFNQIKDKISNIRALGAAAMNLMKVADGNAEACIDFNMKPWDFAATVLIIEEAGGKITDLKGNRLGLENNDVLASNGKEHEEILRILEG